jgi:hypothetical protein
MMRLPPARTLVSPEPPWVAGAAGPAAAAERERHDDVVADREVGHVSADLLDYTRALVAQHAGQGEGDEPLAGTEVGVAEPGGDDAHEHLVALRAFDLDLFEHERFVVGGQHRCGGGRHGCSPR